LPLNGGQSYDTRVLCEKVYLELMVYDRTDNFKYRYYRIWGMTKAKANFYVKKTDAEEPRQGQ